jgi:hypothetical protein
MSQSFLLLIVFSLLHHYKGWLESNFLSNGVVVKEPYVNMIFSVAVIDYRNSPDGVIEAGTSSALSLTGDTNKRELKLLEDTFGQTTSESCLSTPLSTELVSGHLCLSTTNCWSPISTPGKHVYNGQIPGEDGISILKSGWIATCYCDFDCDVSPSKWIVVGRTMFRGPLGDQTWVFTDSIPFNLTVNGWGLRTSNRLLIASSETSCSAASVDGSIAQYPTVFGPSGNYGAPWILGGSGTMKTLTSAADLLMVGSIITFGWGWNIYCS